MLSWPCARCSTGNLCPSCPKRNTPSPTLEEIRAEKIALESLVSAAQIQLNPFRLNLIGGDYIAAQKCIELAAEMLLRASQRLKKLAEGPKI